MARRRNVPDLFRKTSCDPCVGQRTRVGRVRNRKLCEVGRMKCDLCDEHVDPDDYQEHCEEHRAQDELTNRKAWIVGRIDFSTRSPFEKLAEGTHYKTLPCPLCASHLILPVIRRTTNCDIEINLYHCNGCGMEAPQHTWDYWKRK